MPTAVLPELPAEPAWPLEPKVSFVPEPEPEPVAEPEPAAKVPFYKKELSFKRGPKAEEEPTPKPETPKQKRFRRTPKEWDAGEGLSEEAPKARASLGRPSLPSLPSLSRGSGGKQLVGLKIGGSQIAAARIRNAESPELLQAARVPLEHGIVVNGELRDPEALAVALKAFFAEHKLPKRGVRLGIANNRIGVRTFEVTSIDGSEAARERDSLPRAGGPADPARGGGARLPGALRGRDRGRPAAQARAPRRRLP